MKTLNRIPILLAIIGSSAIIFTQKTIAQEIKVMSYNIFHGEKYYERGKSNLKDIATVIDHYKPDFVALQEVDSMTDRSASINNGIPQDLIKILAEKTGMYGFFGKAIDYGNGGYGEGILSRYPGDVVNYKLPNTKGGEGRALLTLEHILPNGLKIIFAGTHLCHEFSENRLEQINGIVSIFRETNLPVILGGDFNFRPDNNPYQVITNYFYDTAEIKGNPQNTISFEKPRARIDYIFVSKGHKWIIKNVEVIKVDASDHMPVLVTLELE